jgi:ProP effector
MQDGIDKLAELFPNCFFRDNHLRRPLKIGIRDEIIARHPDLRPGLIVSALKMYTRCVPYWDTLKAGAVRIDLDGNPAGEVTIEEAQHALVLIAKAARRAAAKEIEARKTAAKAAAAKPVEKCAVQQNPIQGSQCQQPAGPRLSLAGLRAAAQARKAQLVAAE